MASKSKKSTSTATQNVAVDAARTNRDGLAIFDSIVTTDTPENLKATLATHQANFRVMMQGNAASIEQLTEIADGVFEIVNSNNAQISDIAFEQLKASREFLKEASENGALVLNLAGEALNKSIDFADNVAEDNNELARQALDLAFDVKSGDATDTINTIALLLTITGVATVYFLTKMRR